MNELIKINSFTGEQKEIKIQENILEYDHRKIDLNTVSDIRYGLEPIRFDMFTIGRKYVLELKYPEGEIVIILKYYFGFSREYFSKIFSQILDEIWQYTGTRLVAESIERIKLGETLFVGKCIITNEGVTFKNNFVKWDNLSYQKNYDRITLNNKENYSVYTNLYYLETYNFDIMIGVLEWVYKYDGLNELKKITQH